VAQVITLGSLATAVHICFGDGMMEAGEIEPVGIPAGLQDDIPMDQSIGVAGAGLVQQLELRAGSS
jgi:hypothetical protein